LISSQFLSKIASIGFVWEAAAEAAAAATAEFDFSASAETKNECHRFQSEEKTTTAAQLQRTKQAFLFEV
jgi:hypothetical protein